MIVYQSSYQQTGKCHWRWPLRMKVISKIPGIEEQFISQKWSSAFVDIAKNDDNNFQLLYFAEGFQQINSFLTNSDVQADIILIDVDPYYFMTNRDFKSDVKQLEILIKTTGASGLYIVSHKEPLDDWFNSFIIELSHNKCVPEALFANVDFMLVIQDEKVESETTLSHQVNCLIEDIYDLPNYLKKKIEVNARLTNDNNINLEDFVSFLENYAPHFGYNHESGEAESIAKINNQLEKQLINEGKHRGSQQHSITFGSPAKRGEPASKPLVPSITIDHDFVPMHSQTSGATQEETAKETNQEEVHGEMHKRFLQSQITNASNPTENFLDFLYPNTAYIIHCRIGRADASWLQANSDLPTDAIFKDTTQADEIIQIQFFPHGDAKPQTDEIRLPIQNTLNSSIATFQFHTSATSDTFSADVYVFHKNRLIQKATLLAHILQDISEKPKPIQLFVEYSFTPDFSSISHRTEFEASFVCNEKEQTGILNNKPIALHFSTELETLVKKIKDRIQNAADDIINHPEDLFAPENVKLLLRMALDGNTLFVNYLHQLNISKGPIQIISKRNEFIPLDFVYSFAAPDANSVLCPNAIQALEEGACKGCDGTQKNPAKYICPFGFWGFRYVIERQTVEPTTSNSPGDYTIFSGPNATKSSLPILQNTIYAMTDRVADSNPIITDQINDAFKLFAKKSIHVNNWEDWQSKITTASPDSLVLIVHIEEDDITEMNKIEIGNGAFLGQNQFDETRIKKETSSPPPFVIIFGCKAADVEHYSFGLSNQLMAIGAAVVVSNFTKIRGRHAAPILIKLLEFLHNHTHQEINLGEIILKLRQHFLSKGIMVSLALTTHGDADWKLKT